MASPPLNPDTRALPPGWIQQYNWEYKQWFYVNTREQPPRSSWEHPIALQGFASPAGPPPDRSPYGGQQQGYGGYSNYQPSYWQPPQQGYYNAPQGGFVGGPSYGAANRGYPQERVVYVEEERKQQRKGPGLGTALLAGGAGLVGGALLMDAVEDHNEREREEGYDQGYQDGFQGSYDDGDFGNDW